MTCDKRLCYGTSVYKQLSLFLLLLFLVWTVALGQSEETLADKEEAREFITRHPYIANVRAFGQSVCSGVLIGPYTVLTAAQCVDPRNSRESMPELWLNTTQSEMLEDTIVVRQVTETLPHPEYTGNARDGCNLALMRLNESVGDLIAIRILPESPDGSVSVDGRNFSILGFGRTSLSSARTITLQITKADVLDPQACINADIGYLEEQMFCVDSQYPCSGDQGGPVFSDSGDPRSDVLFGLASGTQCFEGIELAGAATLATNASISWIRQTKEEFESRAIEEHTYAIDVLEISPASEPMEEEEELKLEEDLENIEDSI